MGGQEALHVLRKTLTIHCHHGLKTYALFVDQVKAFNSINHDMLNKILAIYGLPENLINTIKKMYNECSVSIPIGKEKIKVSYNTGVQQGDIMAPILFIFMMQAAMDLIALVMDQPLEFRHFPDKANANVQPRRLITQPTKSQGDTFNVDNLLYVGDECFLFAIKEHLEKATQQLFNHFAKFGLQMHVGTKKKTKWKQCISP